MEVCLFVFLMPMAQQSLTINLALLTDFCRSRWSSVWFSWWEHGRNIWNELFLRVFLEHELEKVFQMLMLKAEGSMPSALRKQLHQRHLFREVSCTWKDSRVYKDHCEKSFFFCEKSFFKPTISQTHSLWKETFSSPSTSFCKAHFMKYNLLNTLIRVA